MNAVLVRGSMIRGSGVEGVSKGSIEAANSRMRTRSDVHPNPSLVSNVFPTQDAVARIVASAKPLTSIPSANFHQITFLDHTALSESPCFLVADAKGAPHLCASILPLGALLARRVQMT